MKALSRKTKLALELIAKAIKSGRKERGMSQQEFASRIGISRNTLSKLEQGEGGTDLGTALEALTLAGVSLFNEGGVSALENQIKNLESKLELLPKTVHAPRKKIKNDF